MHSNEESQYLKPDSYENSSANGSEERETSSPQQFRRSPRLRMRILGVLFGLSLLLNIFYLFHDIHDRLVNDFEQNSFQSGYRTDFKPALSAIKTRRVLFEGSPQFLPNGTMYYPEPKSSPRYIGEPSEEIDDNWEALTRARYWLVSEDEAKDAFGAREYQKYWDPKTQGYIAGFDAQHTLHCLNFLRKSFYPDYYNDLSPVHGIIHRDHCIDHLRQLVQCQGDITPIPTRYREGIGRNYIDSDRWHTCRDWSSITRWVEKRHAESRKIIGQQTHGKVDFTP